MFEQFTAISLANRKTVVAHALRITAARTKRTCWRQTSSILRRTQMVSIAYFEPCTASHVGPGFGGTVLLLSIIEYHTN
jgi:hypothetical protein